MIKVIFISGRFRSKWGFIGRVINVIKSVRIARKLSRLGYAVFCPHLNALLIDPTDKDGMRKDIEILKRCDGICMLRGWEKSDGACIEYDIARDRNMIIMEE